MKLLYSLIYIIIIFNLISSSNQKKKKIKKKIDSKLPNGLPKPDSVRPDYIIPELFCETCRAVVNEVLKELRFKIKESDVIYYLSNICLDEEKFNAYEYIPKDIKATCGIFMGVYEDELTKFLSKRNTETPYKSLIYDFCDEYTQICKGVEVNYEKSFTKIERNKETNVGGIPLSVNIHKTGENNNNNKDKKNKKKKINKASTDKNKDSDL